MWVPTIHVWRRRKGREEVVEVDGDLFWRGILSITSIWRTELSGKTVEKHHTTTTTTTTSIIPSNSLNMKLILLSSALPLASAFVGPIFPSTKYSSDTQLMATTSRRSMIQSAGFILVTLAAPTPSNAGTANPFFAEEVNFEPSQAHTSDKIDINGAIVVDYMQFPGMYPSAAGKIVRII